MDNVALQERFKSLVEKKDEISRKVIELKTKESVAQESLKSMMEKLKTEFNVESIEEAEALLKTMTEEVQGVVEECEAFLKEFEV